MIADDLTRAARDLTQAADLDLLLRGRLAHTREELEEVSRALEHAAALREDLARTQRELLERADEVLGQLTRIGAGLDEVDSTVHKSVDSLRRALVALEHEGPTSPPSTEQTAAAARAAEASQEALAMVRLAREGVDFARSVVHSVVEDTQPVRPPAGDALPRLGVAYAELDATATRASIRSQATQDLANRSMALAVLLAEGAGAQPDQTLKGRPEQVVASTTPYPSGLRI